MIRKMGDRLGSGGVWLAALSCGACFPLLGSLASALGLGFLAQFEGIAINILLPIFAVITLIANSSHWINSQNHIRGLLSIIGPIAVLFTLYPLWQYSWSTYLFYGGIILMMTMSIIEIVKPTKEITCKL